MKRCMQSKYFEIGPQVEQNSVLSHCYWVSYPIPKQCSTVVDVMSLLRCVVSAGHAALTTGAWTFVPKPFLLSYPCEPNTPFRAIIFLFRYFRIIEWPNFKRLCTDVDSNTFLTLRTTLQTQFDCLQSSRKVKILVIGGRGEGMAILCILHTNIIMCAVSQLRTYPCRLKQQ